MGGEEEGTEGRGGLFFEFFCLFFVFCFWLFQEGLGEFWRGGSSGSFRRGRRVRVFKGGLGRRVLGWF